MCIFWALFVRLVGFLSYFVYARLRERELIQGSRGFGARGFGAFSCDIALLTCTRACRMGCVVTHQVLLCPLPPVCLPRQSLYAPQSYPTRLLIDDTLSWYQVRVREPTPKPLLLRRSVESFKGQLVEFAHAFFPICMSLMFANLREV